MTEPTRAREAQQGRPPMALPKRLQDAILGAMEPEAVAGLVKGLFETASGGGEEAIPASKILVDLMKALSAPQRGERRHAAGKSEFPEIPDTAALEAGLEDARAHYLKAVPR